MYDGKLHIVHLGNSSNDLWHSTFDGNGWTPNVKIHGQTSKASPALAVYDGKLHIVHLGNSSNDLWHSTFDGNGWTPNVKIHGQTSKASPALAVYDGKLHIVHLGNRSNDLSGTPHSTGKSGLPMDCATRRMGSRMWLFGIKPPKPPPGSLSSVPSFTWCILETVRARSGIGPSTPTTSDPHTDYSHPLHGWRRVTARSMSLLEAG